MEPPAKRLRILQSVEVDEENPDYINAKQKQQQKFKGRLESIFAKYESMHESMSDEIDMRENKVVVDRGHLRRLVRQVNRKETVLLDNLGMAAGHEPEPVSEKEEGAEESEDELAPTQRPKLNKKKTEEIGEGEQTMSTARGAQHVNGNSTLLHVAHPNTPANPTMQAAVQLSNTPNPTTNLLQLVQFPQTPAGQQAQTAFYTTLAQTINQAVQQAVAPLFSGILPNTPNVQLPLGNALQTPSAPVIAGDRIAPATDPKWFFPPLSAEVRKLPMIQSSPILVLATKARLDDAPAEHIEEIIFQQERDKTEVELTSNSSRSPRHIRTVSTEVEERKDENPTRRLRRTSPRVEIRRKDRDRPRRYLFTKDDDIYISRRKVLHQRTWPEIKSSKKKWMDWPLHVFELRWSQHLEGQKLHLTNVVAISQDARDHAMSQVTQNEVHGLAHNRLRSSPQSHHLPTPSSLEHEENEKGVDFTQQLQINDALPSSSHFDEDELELLSLAGADIEEEQLPIENEDELFYAAPEEIILPSIETTEFVDEGVFQQGLLEDSPMEHATPTVTVATVDIVKTEPILSSPTTKRKRKPKPISFQVVPDSDAEHDDDLDFVDASSSLNSNDIFSCGICQKVFKTAKNLERHQSDPRNKHEKVPRKQSGSIDLVGDDEIQAPTTPYIKREFSTPPPTSLLLRTPALQTSKSFPQHSGIHSSGSTTTSKLDRKAFLKQVKQSWARKSSPGPKTLTKRRSFHTVPMKRARAGDAESEDELA